MEEKQVETVPPTPIAPVKYLVSYNEKDPLSSVSDNWNWGRSQPCKRKGFCAGGRRTLQICRGSLQCPNPKCPFQKINKKKNTVDFTRAKNCIHCKHPADSIECTARKYVENDRCHKEMRVIYIGEHNCTPRAVEKTPPKEDEESILRVKPTITPEALQIDKVREALLSGKDANEVNNVAMEYSNKRHLKFLHKSIKQKTCPGGKDIEAIRGLKEDFVKRGLDENLILEVGEDYVILSSEVKIRIAAQITLGLVTEPVSLDGCESHAKEFTEIEMTTYSPTLRRNVKLVSMFAPKPGENAENVERMVTAFDSAVNKILPTVAREFDLNPDDFAGNGLDPHSYVGDEGGALWSGLQKANGDNAKNKSISDAFHLKQDVNRHLKFFKTSRDQNKFKKLMNEASNAPTSIQAEQASKALDSLIERCSSDPAKMMNFKKWWWRRRVRWQQWCKSYSTSSASSAEVSNAKAISASGYRKRLLDVVTAECSASILEAAEVKRQENGLKTVGEGPTAFDRNEGQQATLEKNTAACSDAVHYISENADQLTDHFDSLTNFEKPQSDYRVNTRDSHRADKRKAKKTSKGKVVTREVTDAQFRYFEKYVTNITLDLLEYKSSMSKFEFKVLDTMGCLETVILTSDSVCCSSLACRQKCQHMIWLFYHIFGFKKEEPLIYKKKFTSLEWTKLVNAFPESVRVTQIPPFAKKGYSVSSRTTRTAKCATCKTELKMGDLQVSTEGP